MNKNPYEVLGVSPNASDAVSYTHLGTGLTGIGIANGDTTQTAAVISPIRVSRCVRDIFPAASGV